MAKLVSDPIFVSFHFSLYFYLIMQCRSKGRFIGVWGGGGGKNECRRLAVLEGSGGMLSRKILTYSVSEIAFSAFREHQFQVIFNC